MAGHSTSVIKQELSTVIYPPLSYEHYLTSH